MRGALFSVLLIFFCCMGGDNGLNPGVNALNCPSNDGSCTWTSPESCINPEKYCGKTAECLVVTKSINSSYSLEMAANYNQQFQCRCPIGSTCNPYAAPYDDLNCTKHRPTDSYVTISANNGMEGQFLSIVYAEMWKCEDNSVIQCPSGRMRIGNEFGCKKNITQLLPNVFALVRFWCQFKNNTCEFDSSLILSHVGQSLQLPEQSALPENYIFEWGSGMTSEKKFDCGNSSQSVLEYDSCYRLTPSNLEWKDARSYCLQLGGDLAQFTVQTDFASILRKLDNSIPSNNIPISKAIPIWFKWYTRTDGEQRTPQHFLQYTNGFQCSVYDFLPNEGINPQAECITGTRSNKVRGLCVLPPKLLSDNFDYVQLSCPAKCGVSGYSDYCWAEAEADTKVSQSCPPDFNGIATWKCGVNGQWITPSPDLSNCINPAVDDSINKANDNLKNGKDPSVSLNNLTNDVKKNDVASGNIVQLDQTIKLAIEQQTSLIVTANSSFKDESSKNFTISVIDLSDVVMANSEAFWGLDWTARTEAIDQVQKNVDDTLYLLAENLLDTVFKYSAINYQSIVIQVENKTNADYNNEAYTYDAEDENQLILPAGFPYLVDDTNTRLSFATYSAFQNLLYGDTLALLFEENQTSSFEPIGQVVVSKVLGATLGQPNGSIQFVDGEFVEILLRTLNLDLYEVNEKSATCVFWNTSTEDWSSDGCEVVVTNDTEEDTSSTRCRCNHLTNFAVLMDINGVFKNKATSALDYITVIGGSISIVCLTLTLIILNWVRTLRRDFRFSIHRNLFSNLLIAEILFLAGIDATTKPDLCLTIAVFMHLFFLCAFSWMFIEGLYMYFLITRVFEGKVLKRWQYYFIGYGVPVLVVAITLGATKTNAYINSSYCWLSYEDGAIWAFAGPAAAVVLVICLFLSSQFTSSIEEINIVFLVFTLTIACKPRQNIASRRNMLQLILGTISLTFFLGITWMFGFLFFGQELGEGIVFAYIFTILNSLQGFFIFITFCVLNKQVRNDLHKQIVINQKFQKFFSNFDFERSDIRMFISTARSGFYNVSQSAVNAPSVELHTADSSFQARVTHSPSNNSEASAELSNRLY